MFDSFRAQNEKQGIGKGDFEDEAISHVEMKNSKDRIEVSLLKLISFLINCNAKKTVSHWPGRCEFPFLLILACHIHIDVAYEYVDTLRKCVTLQRVNANLDSYFTCWKAFITLNSINE